MLSTNKYRTRNIGRRYKQFFLVNIDEVWTPVKGRLSPKKCVRWNSTYSRLLVYLDEDGNKRFSIYPQWRVADWHGYESKFKNNSFEYALEVAAETNISMLEKKFVKNTDLAEDLDWLADPIYYNDPLTEA
jgi:hypothetical protein